MQQQQNKKGIIPVLTLKRMVPDADTANKIIRSYMDDNPDTALSELIGDEHEIVQNIFGFSDEHFIDIMIDMATMRDKHPSHDKNLKGVFEDVKLEAMSDIKFWCSGQKMRDIDPIEIDVDQYLDKIELPKRGISDIPVDLLKTVIVNIEDFGPQWYYEDGYPSWFHVVGTNTNDIIRVFDDISKEYLKDKKQFFEKYGIKWDMVKLGDGFWVG